MKWLYGRYQVLQEWHVPARGGYTTCRRLRDYGEQLRVSRDKYWKRPAGAR